MGKFMEHATSVMKQYADKVAFLNEKREMTHGELDRESGQIYAWLKKQGIGREDFVQIVLPRGPECIAALMGVLRAGAAFLISE
ncbi:MAG: AMP-binding protein, partial [Selenomonadaceae bacterium]|nr:AMP-binding protein [Selenomonadaceae bacterium]